MTTRREYAASLGLAKPNTRGRLSREAHAAIAKAESEGVVFDDATPAKPVKQEPAPAATAAAVAPKVTPLSLPVPKSLPKREASAYIATLKGGQVIAFGMCSKCKNYMQWCPCQTPAYPDWVKDEIDTWEPA